MSSYIRATGSAGDISWFLFWSRGGQMVAMGLSRKFAFVDKIVYITHEMYSFERVKPRRSRK